MSATGPGPRDPGLPYGGGPEEAAADAEPTVAHETAAPPNSPSGDTPAPGAAQPAPAAAAPPLAIPGIPLDRPELHLAAAFAGGFVLAMLLKRLAR
jgi:hypothetical protein